MSRTIMFVLVGLLCATPGWGVVIVDQTAFTGDAISSLGPTFWGQSFTTPVGGPWNNLTFNFYRNAAHDPAAVGTLYILDELGWLPGEIPVPDQLSETFLGYVAHSEAVNAFGTGTAWYFPSTAQLEGGTKYWAFMDESGYWPDPDFLLVNGDNPFTAGESYYAQGASSGYGPSGAIYDLNFSLNGLPVSAVPESGTACLLALGLLGLASARRRGRPGGAGTTA